MSFARTPHSPPRTPTRAVSVRRRVCNKSSRAGIAADCALFQVTGEWRAPSAAVHDTLRTSKTPTGGEKYLFRFLENGNGGVFVGLGHSRWNLGGGSQAGVERHLEWRSGATRLGEHR